MKMTRCIILFLAAVVIAGCSSTPTRRSMKEQWNDSMTASRVKWRLGQDKLVSSHNIDVNIWRGTVIMIGHVATEEEKARAEEVAKGVQGVTQVKNYVEVAGASAPAKSGQAADEPAAKEKKTFAKKLPPPAVEGGGAKTVTEDDLMEESVTTTDGRKKRQNGVSYQIGKDLASTEEGKAPAKRRYAGAETEHADDITLQAEQELKELKERKSRR